MMLPLLVQLALLAAAARACSVADHGAVPDNRTDNSRAFRNAAAACSGGEILVPAGTWLTGPFNLSSNTVLRLAPGATISGSRAPEAYPVVTQQPLDEACKRPARLPPSPVLAALTHVPCQTGRRTCGTGSGRRWYRPTRRGTSASWAPASSTATAVRPTHPTPPQTGTAAAAAASSSSRNSSSSRRGGSTAGS